MRVCHTVSAGFDDPNLVSCAGLIPVMTLAERPGLHDLARAHVRVPGSAGSNADVKVAALVAGMVAGADSIDASAVTFTLEFAPARPGTLRCSAARSCRPARRASARTNPATDTRFGSSKTAETLSEACIYRMLLLVSQMVPS